NNGSTDHTAKVLEKYQDHPKVRLFDIKENRGAIGGMNFALDQIHGEWFATLGDHDEIVPHAFETLLRVVDDVDPTITAVTANAISSTTGELCGLGLDRDQYLPIEVIVNKTGGDFFGITKTELLGGKRLNENLKGNANAFWYQIDAIVNRYYIHQALKIFNTESGDTATDEIRLMDIEMKSNRYHELANETFFWKVLKEHNQLRFEALCIRGYFFSKASGDIKSMAIYSQMLNSGSISFRYQSLFMIISHCPPLVLESIYRFIGITQIGHLMSNLIIKPFGRIGYLK
ncbi:MAG: glycosyltransferase, partial [Saprospiraceae bacterium]|nr:glycosyltransferase [Saprospiraceae bacterium]